MLEIGAAMAVVTLLTIDIYMPRGLIEWTQDLAKRASGTAAHPDARIAGFTVVVCQLFNCFNSRFGVVRAFRYLLVPVAVGHHCNLRPPDRGGPPGIPQHSLRHRVLSSHQWLFASRWAA